MKGTYPLTGLRHLLSVTFAPAARRTTFELGR